MGVCLIKKEDFSQRRSSEACRCDSISSDGSPDRPPKYRRACIRRGRSVVSPLTMFSDSRARSQAVGA